MRILLLSALLAAPAAAQETCWRENVSAGGLRLHAAVVPASSFRPDFGAKTFVEASRLGLVVTNGTFFGSAGGLEPLGDVVADGRALYRPERNRYTASDGRRIDLSLRWGLGVDGGGQAFVVTGAEARRLKLRQYLGGAGLLLSAGRDALAEDAQRAGDWGPAFPPGILEGSPARTAVGITLDGALVVVQAPRPKGAALPALAAALRELGAVEAVFYDGGRASGFSAGAAGDAGRILSKPHPAEDLNPTHLVFTACR